MQWKAMLVCFWPGLKETWAGASWLAFAWCTGLALGCNLCLAGTFLWPTSLPPVVIPVAWFAVAMVWILGVWRELRCYSPAWASDTGDPGLFNLAQAEYLKGHGFEAQELLVRSLEQSPEDVDARLLLASLFRRTRQWDSAQETLARLELSARADKWRLEIEIERKLIERDADLDSAALTGEVSEDSVNPDDTDSDEDSTAQAA